MESLIIAAKLALGGALLLAGADALVRGASSLARLIGISDLAVGLTVVAMGTSAPELMVSLLAAWRGAPDITVGNVLGSNIANILLILGLAAALHPLDMNSHLARRDIPMAMLAALLTGLFLNIRLTAGVFGPEEPAMSRPEGLALLGLFAAYLWRVLATARDAGFPAGPIRIYSSGVSLLLAAAGVLALALGGELTVAGAMGLARRLGLSEAFIGLTIVAVGTSLPELATTLLSALRGNPDLAVGNVIGSNIFNSLWILGMSAVIAPVGYNRAMNVDLGISLLAALAILLLSRGGSLRLGRAAGLSFLASYAAYIAYLTGRG